MSARHGTNVAVGGGIVVDASVAAAWCFDDVLVPAVVRIARAQRLTAHDAAYLELAMRVGLPLATRNTSPHAAAERVGVALYAA